MDNENAAGGTPESNEEALGDIMGSLIRKSFPNDLHFLCGCANFDPCGHNEVFREVARTHFRQRMTQPSGTYVSGQCKVRAEVTDVIELANRKAEEATGVPGSRFRIWKPNLPPKKRLNESNWEESSFKDITENVGSLKKNLEWPLRRALEDVRKALQSADPIATTNSQHREHATSFPDSSIPSPDTVGIPSNARPALNSNENDRVEVEEPFPQYSPSAVKRPRLDLSPDEVVREFVNKYNKQEYMDALDRLDKDRGSKNIEDWAKEIYTTLRKCPDDERAKMLNLDHKNCLNLLYDLVLEWEKHEYSDEFEQAIDCVFKTRRLVRILAFCLPMDRAQSLYKMRCATCPKYGMPWYSEHHLEAGNAYARDHPEEQLKWIQSIGSYSGFPTMNKKLFRLLFSDRLCLRSNEDFRRWSRPAEVPPNEEHS